MLTTLRMTAPLVRRTTTLRGMASAAHKVTVLEDLEAVESFRKNNPKSVLYFTAVWVSTDGCSCV